MGVTKAPRHAVSARASGSADSVDVDLGIFGEVVVDDVADAVDIEAAGRKVAGHQDAQVAASESIHHLVSLALDHVPVDGVGIDVLAVQELCHVVDRAFGATEDHRQCAGSHASTGDEACASCPTARP